jgi:hypothetical protein
MWKVSPLALILVGLCPGLASSVEIKNLRSTYGPYGAVRADKKIMGGDFIFLMFDIEELKVDAKSGLARYEIAYKLMDSQGKEVVGVSKKTPQEINLPLGGDRVPGELALIIGPEQAPGNYKVSLTVTDRIAKDGKNIEYAFEILRPAFGFMNVLVHAGGLPGQLIKANFGISKMALDKKQAPNVEITMRILDDSGKALGQPILKRYPRDLPDGINLQTNNFVQEYYSVYLNRPGRFTIALDAEDKIGKQQVAVRIPLTVFDLSKLAIESK